MAIFHRQNLACAPRFDAVRLSGCSTLDPETWARRMEVLALTGPEITVSVKARVWTREDRLVTAHEPSERPRDRLARTARRLLWLDDANRRTDTSRANRGFYVGGPAVGWRFVLPVVIVGIAIALVVRVFGLMPT